jgi:hypothetical protein
MRIHYSDLISFLFIGRGDWKLVFNYGPCTSDMELNTVFQTLIPFFLRVAFWVFLITENTIHVVIILCFVRNVAHLLCFLDFAFKFKSRSSLQPEDGDNMDLWNVGILSEHYTASQPKYLDSNLITGVKTSDPAPLCLNNCLYLKKVVQKPYHFLYTQVARFKKRNMWRYLMCL